MPQHEVGSSDSPPTTSSHQSIWRFLLFLLIQLLLAPFSLLGAILFILKLKLDNQPKGISGTAYEPFWGRVLAHVVGARSDESAIRLSNVLPASSALIQNLINLPTSIAYQLSGYVPVWLRPTDTRPASVMSMMAVRHAFFDDELRNAMNHVQQIVILGSAWDTRAYEQLRDWSHPIFEVDMPATLRAKVEALDRAGIDRDHVTFVETDFDQTSWRDAVEAQGFDPTLTTFILWEGVTMYVAEEGVAATLNAVADLAPDSRIAFDYFAREFIEGEGAYRLLSAYGKLAFKLTYGEEFIFGIPMRPVAKDAAMQFLSAHGLTLEHFDMVGRDGKLSAIYGFAAAANR